MKYRVALGEVIREARIERNLRLRDMQDRANMALGYLSEVERGHKEISSELLECVADALELPVHRLVQLTAWKLEVEDFSKTARVSADYLL